MKKLFLFSGLLSMILMVLPQDVSAAKKRRYRYIKRQHGVQTVFNLSANPLSPTDLSVNFNGSYHYNYKGAIEFGPYWAMSYGLGLDFTAGIFGEYNFSKNRGKRKLIPSLGFKIGYSQMHGQNLEAGTYASLKYFVARRTAFIGTFEYLASASTPLNIRSIKHNLNVLGGFAYYFDFY